MKYLVSFAISFYLLFEAHEMDSQISLAAQNSFIKPLYYI